eukprot:scaffold34652_cov36-Cyclotella_meneghiniana.AAC.1
MDVGSKILSCILTERAYKLLEKHGVKSQFGATPLVGCPEGSFSLKTLLHLRHQHNLPSYVAYVDLVKAYDTANHEVLLKLLEKYGAPPQFTDIVRRLYSNLRVIINIDGKALSIPQTSGVRQGDNLSPVLFLFIMSAAAETLDIELEKNNIEKPVCHGVDINNLDKGLLTGQTPRNFSSGRTFKLLEFLYIDDGAFVFGSRANLIKGLKLIRKCFAAFGLEMHIGKNGEASKTECIFYPTSSWFHDTQDNLCLPQNSNTNQTPNTLLLPNASPSPPTDESPTLALEEKKEAESYIKRKARCDIKYDTCEETNRIMLDSEGYVDFTKDFLYLGSSTSYDLRDDQDIARRINIASRSMGMLKNFWDNPSIDLYTKHLFYLAIPINLLLWGCESWALKKSSLKKLEAFHHRSIRRILKINMTQVREDKIRNEKIREQFHNIPDIGNLIAAFQLRFVGKTVRHPNPNHIPKLLLSAWVNHKRPAHGVLETNKKAIVKSLQRLYLNNSATNPFEGGFGHMDAKGSFNLWYRDALDEKKWNWLIEAQLRRTHLKINKPNSDNNSNQSPPSPNSRSAPPSPPPNNNNHRPMSRSLIEALSELDLPPSASLREAKMKFRQLCRIYHPDKHKSDVTGLTDTEAKEKFQRFNNAYEFVKDKLRA